ncbi:hypothetical protein EN935_03725 [Mesorhizobium sp. M7D.F.Ca.US.004.03.1.1]|nr:hypothetical protein EN935_03725 [Mesorhizobium sp. M7D.F.Ca.US.004.03.1.1]
MLRFGDTPTGGYRVCPVELDELRYPPAEFGGSGIIPLIPISDDAACAEAIGRYCFAIFGGPLAPDRSLRSTAGGLRMHDADFAAIVENMKLISCTRCKIVEVASLPDYGIVFNDCNCQHADPLIAPEFQSTASETFPSHSWAASALALGMTVTFAALPTSVYADDRTKAVETADNIQATFPERNVLFAQIAQESGGYARLAYNSDSSSVEPPDNPAEPDIVNSETQNALQGAPPPEPQTYSSEVTKISNEVVKDIPTEAASQTVDVLKYAAEKMADSSEAANWRPAVSVLDNADTEFSISNYSVASEALEALGNAFKLKSAYDSGTRIGTAINDLQAGKIDMVTFTQQVGPEPAKILAAYSGIPFSDHVVDLGVATLNKGASSAIDFGFDMYDKYKGYDVQPAPGGKK